MDVAFGSVRGDAGAESDKESERLAMGLDMKILLAEDSRSVSMVLTARLESLGCEVVAAVDGVEALEKFSSSQEKFDLVLMDIEMPRMNGFEACARIRAREAQEDWSWTPILFLTASDTQENLVASIEAGGDDFLPKKVGEAVLRAKMKALTRVSDLRTRLERSNARLARLAREDALTGLPNRRELDDRVDRMWAGACDSGGGFGVALLDVDRFKAFNDSLGHAAGDRALEAVGRALSAATAGFVESGGAAGSFAARYGGEEFALVVPSGNGVGRLAEAARSAVEALGLSHPANGDLSVVTATVGWSQVPSALGPVGALFREADSRLYWGKESGRNRVSGFAQEE